MNLLKSLLPPLLLLCGNVFGQGTASIELEIAPEKCFVRIDGDVHELKNGKKTILLEAGTYQLEVWAPFFDVYTEQVTIITGQTLKFTKGLTNVVDGYEDFKQKQEVYLEKKHKRVISGGAIITGNLLVGYLAFGNKWRKGISLRNQAEAFVTDHSNAVTPEDVALSLDNYQQTVADYTKTREDLIKQRKIGIPLFAITSAATGYFFYRRSKSKLTKPVLDSINPFTGSFQPAGSSFTYDGRWTQLALAFKF